MELASMLAGERFSDRPSTASPVIAAFLRTYNDGLDDDRRQDLYPLASLIVGTAGSRAVERERMSRCLEFARSLGAGAPAGRAAIGIASAEGSGSWAALAALRDGPSSGTHPRVVEFVRELVAIQGDAPRRRWLRWPSAFEPAGAVEEAMADAQRGSMLASAGTVERKSVQPNRWSPTDAVSEEPAGARMARHTEPL